MTSVHVIEDLVEYPINVYCKETFKARVIARDGEETIIDALAHDPIVAETRIDNCKEKEQQILNYGLETHVIRPGRVGRGDCYLISAAALERMLEELLEQGITIYKAYDHSW